MAIVHQSSATGTALSGTCNKPTGTSVGDVLVAVVFSQSSAASLTGWTVVPASPPNISAAYYLTALYRVVDGTEGSSFTFTASSSIFLVGISRFSGVDTASPIDGTPTGAAGTGSATATPASITTTVNGSMLVLLGGSIDSGSTVTNITFSAGTEQWSNNYGPDVVRIELATETIASAGATGTRTITSVHAGGGTPHTLGILLALKNISGTPATVNAAIITGTGNMLAGSLSAAVSLSSPIITGTGNMLLGGVPYDVLAALITGSGGMLVPTDVTGEVALVAVPLTATGNLAVASLQAGASIDAAVIGGTGAMQIVGVQAAVNIAAPVLTASGVMLDAAALIALGAIPFRGRGYTVWAIPHIHGHTAAPRLPRGYSIPPSRGPKRGPS